MLVIQRHKLYIHLRSIFDESKSEGRLCAENKALRKWMSFSMFPRIYYLPQPLATSCTTVFAALKPFKISNPTILSLFVWKKQKTKHGFDFAFCRSEQSQPRGNANELLFSANGLQLWNIWIVSLLLMSNEERKIKDCQIAFSSSQAECCFINSFFDLLLCECEGSDWRRGLAHKLGRLWISQQKGGNDMNGKICAAV